MQILYQNRKLEELCRDKSLRLRKLGKIYAKNLEIRLEEFKQAETLQALYTSFKKADCHELTGNRKGTLAVTLSKGLRLVFEPANDPVPRKPDGGLDRTHVTVVRLLSVENYHG